MLESLASSSKVYELDNQIVTHGGFWAMDLNNDNSAYTISQTVKTPIGTYCVMSVFVNQNPALSGIQPKTGFVKVNGSPTFNRKERSPIRLVTLLGALGLR
jgi:hypothetical protein